MGTGCAQDGHDVRESKEADRKSTHRKCANGSVSYHEMSNDRAIE